MTSSSPTMPAIIPPRVRAKELRAETPRARLIVSDFFDDRAGYPHGRVVVEAARDLDFGGEIVERQAPRTREMVLADRFFSRLDQRHFPPDEMRQFLYDYALNRQVGELKSATEELVALSQTENSVLNLSRGWGQAQVVEAVYTRLRLAWDVSAYPQDRIVAQRRLGKIGPALGVDVDRILDGSRAERGRLQQELIDLVAATAADSKLTAAQHQYDLAVSSFEALDNSVVVAAANSGTILEVMAQDADPPRVPPEFFRNRLVNDKTTAVGATRARGGHEEVADYTNPDPNIDLYADGDVGQAWGTSFATPRIAALMADLHRRHPQAGSAEVEFMVGQTFSSTLPGYGHHPEAPALEEDLAREWLRSV